MQHFVTYPLIAHPYRPELVTKRALVRFVTRAEEPGSDGVGFTDHPAPSHRWQLFDEALAAIKGIWATTVIAPHRLG